MRSSTCGFLCLCLFVCAFVAGIILIVVATGPNKNYNVVIDSVSGLHLPPSKAPVMDPQFNLTLQLASTNPISRECMHTDSYIQVSYRCVPLAASVIAPHGLCVGPKKSTEVHLVAKGTGVHLSGSLMDNLAADRWSGVEAFEVRLIQPSSYWVASCGARRIGDGGAWCGDYWDMCAPEDKTTSDDLYDLLPIFIPPPVPTEE